MSYVSFAGLSIVVAVSLGKLSAVCLICLSWTCVFFLEQYDDMSMTNNRPGYSEVVSLTLDEIALIRGALAKAELENLEEQDQRLFDNVRQQKVRTHHFKVLKTFFTRLLLFFHIFRSVFPVSASSSGRGGCASPVSNAICAKTPSVQGVVDRSVPLSRSLTSSGSDQVNI